MYLSILNVVSEPLMQFDWSVKITWLVVCHTGSDQKCSPLLGFFVSVWSTWLLMHESVSTHIFLYIKVYFVEIQIFGIVLLSWVAIGDFGKDIHSYDSNASCLLETLCLHISIIVGNREDSVPKWGSLYTLYDHL